MTGFVGDDPTHADRWRTHQFNDKPFVSVFDAVVATVRRNGGTEDQAKGEYPHYEHVCMAKHGIRKCFIVSARQRTSPAFPSTMGPMSIAKLSTLLESCCGTDVTMPGLASTGIATFIRRSLGENRGSGNSRSALIRSATSGMLTSICMTRNFRSDLGRRGRDTHRSGTTTSKSF